jgi:apolipoprotein N-acyltransferase
MVFGLTLLSGIVIVLSFPPWDFRFLIFVALIPWLASLQRLSNWKSAVVQGIWLSMAMTLLGFYWVAYVLHQFGGLPWAVASLGLFLFSTFGQPQFAFFAPFYRVASQRRNAARGGARLVWGIAIALLYTGMDWLIPKLFRDTLGHSQYTAPWLRQSADLFGAHGITFLIFWFNDSLLSLFLALRNRKEPSFWPATFLGAPSLLAASVALALAVAYGQVREKEIQAITAQAHSSVRAAVIQGNIGDFDKIAAKKGIRGASDTVMNQYFSLSDRALAQTPRPDFLVWPETAYPATFRTPMTPDDLARDERVDDFVRNRKFPLLFGGYDRMNGKDFNAFFVLTPLHADEPPESGLQVYRKNILLLFGEYVPFTENSRFFQSLFPQIANFGRGIGPEVLPVRLSGDRTVRVSPIICYEALFPDYVIEAANKGSQLIMNITNDSWFGPRGEPQLHLSLTVFRGIETRLPQLRATNTGISALILPDGSITSASQLFTEQILAVDVPLIDSPPTLMKRWGDWFGKFALAASLVLLAALGFHRRPTSTA